MRKISHTLLTFPLLNQHMYDFVLNECINISHVSVLYINNLCKLCVIVHAGLVSDDGTSTTTIEHFDPHCLETASKTDTAIQFRHLPVIKSNDKRKITSNFAL